MGGESALGGTLRLEAPIVAQTVRCYEMYKVDCTSLQYATTGIQLPTSPTDASVNPTAASPAQGANAPSMRFPPSQDVPQPNQPASDESLNAGMSSAHRRSTLDHIWRIATLSDLLLLAICVLINVPSVAKLLTAAATSEMAAAATTDGAALVSLASAGGARTMSADHHDLLSVERMAALLSFVVSATPFKAILALDSIGVWLRANVPIHFICVQVGSDHAAVWQRLAELWRGTVAPILASPPIFWTLILCAVVLMRLSYRARHVYMQRVVVVSGVGMQLTTFNYLGRVVQQKFLDVNRIHSVVIHEAFLRQRVVFYLAAIVDNESDVTVLFEEMVPRLSLLRPLLCGIRSVLFQESEHGPTLGELEEQGAANTNSGALPVG